MRITKKDKLRIAILIFGVIIFHLVGWKMFGEKVLLLGLELLMLGILGILLLLFRKIEQLFAHEHKYNRKMHYRTQGKQQNYYTRLESLFSLFCVLDFQAPFPETGEMAASPDFLKKIAEFIYQKQPELIIEASSGVSTLIAAYCLKHIGKGRIISLEQDAKYASISQKLVESHGLQDIATVMHAPLTEIQIHGNAWLWYDIQKLKLDKPIDMLLVDGPPAKIQTLARYPVLPLLFDQLNADCIILLDDGRRPDEKKIVELWLEEFSGLEVAYLSLEKGAYLIRKPK